MTSSKKILVSTLACVTFSLAQGALAQTTAYPPLANNVPMGAPLTLEQARKVVALAEAESKKRQWPMAIEVVQPNGTPVLTEYMDGTQYASIAVAHKKALASALFRRPTKVQSDALKGGRMEVLALPGAMPVAGGYPLMENGKMVGALGVSGGSDDQDELIASLAAQLMK